MRIAYLINSMARGGAEVQVKNLALRFRRDGHDVAVVVVLEFSAFADELAGAGVAMMALAARRNPSTVFMRLTRFLRRFRPEIVHTHLFHANLLGRLHGMSPLRDSVIVSTSHCLRERQVWRDAAYRLTDSFCDVFTAVSRRAIIEHERACAAPRGRMLYVPNGIDVAQFADDEGLRVRTRRELELHGFTWLAIGAFRDEDKDFSTMLRAFAQSHPDEHLVIVGAGRLIEQKKQLARELGVAARVKFVGQRADIPALLNAADAFLMSSMTEAMPLVLLEAAAAGLPTVATDVGDVPQIVLEGESGYLAPPRQPSALAKAMRRLRDSPNRPAFGARARTHVRKQFDIDSIMHRWANIYGARVGERATEVGNRKGRAT